MAEKEKMIQVEVDGKPVEITVARASAKRGVMRFRLMAAEQVAGDEDLSFVKLYEYPSIAAGTVAVQGMDWPITADQLADMDEDVVNTWIEAVYTVNPNWEPRAQVDQDALKKELAEVQGRLDVIEKKE